MAASVPLSRRIVTTATWPAGIALTSWRYIWRTTPIHRRELRGSLERDLPPALPAEVSQSEVQQPQDGTGALLHRTYSGVIVDGSNDVEDLMADLQRDPGRAAPSSLARFQKTSGEEERMAVGDEWLVRMPGPWDGPVRVVQVTPSSFRFATLAGHLEAGQIEWRVRARGDALVFQVESWARAGDRLSALMHDRLRMAKEVQLHMWSSVVEKVARRVGGRLERGVDIETRRVAPDAFGD
jgi:Domain of unknown function (DUF1990)